MPDAALVRRVAKTGNFSDTSSARSGVTLFRPFGKRMDNGPELIAWTLRDWYRLKGTTTSCIEPGSPWEKPLHGASPLVARAALPAGGSSAVYG